MKYDYINVDISTDSGVVKANFLTLSGWRIYLQTNCFITFEREIKAL